MPRAPRGMGWRDYEGLFKGFDLTTLVSRAFHLNPRNASWRVWRDAVRSAQESKTGAYELARHAEALDWTWSDPA